MSSIVVEPQTSATQSGPVFSGATRWGVALLLVASSLLQLVSQVLEPESADATARVAYWAAHPTRIGLSMTLTLVSVPLTIGAIAALVALTRARSPRLAWTGGAVIITALVGLATVVGLELMAYWTALAGNLDAAAAGLDSDEIGLPGVVLLVLFVGGAVAGMGLMAAAMWRSPRLPRAAAVLLVAFVVTDMVIGQALVGHGFNVAWSAVVAGAVLTGYRRRPRAVAE